MSERDDVIAGRYRLLEQVGSGGMGAVWRARDELLERDVAVKQLHLEPDLAPAGQPGIGPERAMREARITARLHHPHAVPVFDAVEHEGQRYLVMQYFPSRSLQDILVEQHTVPPATAARIGSEVASALATAHRAGVVHRDVKPANVLLAADGTSKITDFGIAHVLGDATLTSTGVITGTPAYMAPEVARGEPSSEASDVFSLGATLYRALEGHPPFPQQENQLALLHLIASGAITPPERSGHLTALLLRMLAVDAAARPSMDEVADALARIDEATAPFTPPMPPPTARLDAVPTEADETTEPEGDAVGGGGGGRRRGRALAALALALAVLVTAGILADRRSGGDERGDDTAALNSEEGPPDGGGTGAVSTPATAEPASSAPTDPGASPAGGTPPPTGDSTTGAPTTGAPAASTTAAPGAPASTTSAPSAAPSTTARPATAAPTSAAPGGAGPTAAQAAEAIRSYYALLPQNRDAGWALLTDRYRRTTAKNRATYDAFWGSVASVSSSDVTGSASGAVTATITYAFTDGRTYVERTSYQLVRQDGVLKIDQSTVLSSSQR